jgi:hypothetical protein
MITVLLLNVETLLRILLAMITLVADGSVDELAELLIDPVTMLLYITQLEDSPILTLEILFLNKVILVASWVPDSPIVPVNTPVITVPVALSELASRNKLMLEILVGCPN